MRIKSKPMLSLFSVLALTLLLVGCMSVEATKTGDSDSVRPPTGKSCEVVLRPTAVSPEGLEMSYQGELIESGSHWVATKSSDGVRWIPVDAIQSVVFDD